MLMTSAKMVFISTGKYSANSSYTKFSKANLALLNEATGFVLTPTGDYHVYGTVYTDYIVALKEQILELPQGKPFYIGIPVINASDSYRYSTADYQRLRSFICDMASVYKNNTDFAGFYFTNERVFGTVSINNLMGNGMLKLMNDLSYVIRNDPNTNIHKDFIWAPYLGYNSSYYITNQNLGMTANRTNIFSTVYLQSGHFFTAKRGTWNTSKRTGQPSRNLDLAYQCAVENAVYNYTGNDDSFLISDTPVGGAKISQTKIAIDMEAQDELKWEQTIYQAAYRQETNRFRTLLINNSCPFLFYAGSYNGIILAGLYQTINAFYENGSCKLPKYRTRHRNRILNGKHVSAQITPSA